MTSISKYSDGQEIKLTPNGSKLLTSISERERSLVVSEELKK